MAKFEQRTVMLPPIQPASVNISFSDIKLQVSSGYFHKESKMVLRGVSGTFRSGELTAIMGPSGAGKSSLLNILTGFHVTGMSGEVRMDGQIIRPGKDGSRKQSCYIMQEDHLNPMFNVMEIMIMAANLKLGNGLPKKAKILVVEDILDSLGMSATKYTKCGRLSGGQKKRLCIALELIDNPPIMYLDEPTSGLDSSSTVQLVTMLKSLARGNRTIVCTIHQPCASIFELFDHAYIISKGVCVYQGSSRNLVPFLQTIGLQCPKYHNPADFLLDVVCGEFGEFTEQMTLAAKDPTWRIPPQSLVPVEFKEENTGKTCVLVSSPSEFSRFMILFKRNVIQLHRDWTVSYLKVFLHMIVGIVMGVLFQNAGSYGNKTITNVSYFMCAIVYQSFTSVMPAVLKFPAEINTLKKEQFNNWYKLRTYYMALLMAHLPLQMLYSIVFISISYYLSGQILEVERFLKFGTVCVMTVLTSECLGLALGTVDNPVNGIFWGSVMLAVQILLAGFLAILTHMPRILYYISFVNYMRYGLEAMVISIYGSNRQVLKCPVDELYCHLRYPEKLLTEIGMDKVNYWVDTAFLGTFFSISCLNAYFFLRRKVKSH
ncbi:ATP-binding cassette sub-family G member 1-like isoform X2 [Cimex lectularius]|uniref:ABC transporter domain-containing protein n=1 Tax=Cimex lectularius TaxID=79782 RepID=A0A8I6RX64_CIMLE|nr:ATP-binding cassette sub-family G member 1-like isoform X2 [Cimex lectularius]